MSNKLLQYFLFTLCLLSEVYYYYSVLLFFIAPSEVSLQLQEKGEGKESATGRLFFAEFFPTQSETARIPFLKPHNNEQGKLRLA